MLQKLKDETGMVVVEAAFVFPVMFFALFFLLYAGNGFYQKAKIDSYVAQYALYGAAQCADPLMTQVASGGGVPTSNPNVRPYRYAFSMGDIEGQTVRNLRASVSDAGFYAGMQPNIRQCSAKFENHILYYNFVVEMEYVVEFPLKFLGEENIRILTMSARSEVPVTDVANFIRNTDMVVDYMDRSEAFQEFKKFVGEAFDKVKGFFSAD